MLSQIPGVETVITEAAKGSNSWVPLLLCVLIFALLTFDWLRERRMAARIDTLENNYTSVLTRLVNDCSKAVADNTSAMLALTKSLDGKPCMWEPAKQREVIHEAVQLAKSEIDG